MVDVFIVAVDKLVAVSSYIVPSSDKIVSLNKLIHSTFTAPISDTLISNTVMMEAFIFDVFIVVE